MSNFNETTSSLQFAERLKKVKLEVKVKNQGTGKLSNLKQELERERNHRIDLEKKLKMLSEKRSPVKDV